MLVYRYEKDGKGPYQNEEVNSPYLESMYMKHSNSTVHPTIGRDVIKDYVIGSAGYVCACPTLPLLKQWFRGYNVHIKRAGFKLYEYEVSKVNDTYSGKQLEFHPSHVVSKRVIK